MVKSCVKEGITFQFINMKYTKIIDNQASKTTPPNSCFLMSDLSFCSDIKNIFWIIRQLKIMKTILKYSLFILSLLLWWILLGIYMYYEGVFKLLEY
jgi:hypothetical protein